MTERTDIESMLAEVEALDCDATPGPWRSAWDEPPSDGFGEHTAVVSESPDLGPNDINRMVVGMIWHDGLNVACSRDNAAFIARSRTLLPALAAEVRRLYGVQQMLGAALQAAAERDKARINQAMNAEMPTDTVEELLRVFQAGYIAAWKAGPEEQRMDNQRDGIRAVLSYLASLGADDVKRALPTIFSMLTNADDPTRTVADSIAADIAPILAAKRARIAGLEQRIDALKDSAQELARAWDAVGDHDLPVTGERNIANVLATLAKERESITEALDAAGIETNSHTMCGEPKPLSLADRVKLLIEHTDDMRDAAIEAGDARDRGDE